MCEQTVTQLKKWDLPQLSRLTVTPCRLTSMWRIQVDFDCLSSLQLSYNANSMQHSLIDGHTLQHRLNSTQATHLIYNILSGSWPLAFSSSKLSTFFNNFIEKQAVNMMPVNQVQSRVCHATVLADAGSLPWSESNRMLTAADIMSTDVIVNKQFLKVTYSPFKQ